jgi:hypothetical protein
VSRHRVPKGANQERGGLREALNAFKEEWLDTDQKNLDIALLRSMKSTGFVT